MMTNVNDFSKTKNGGQGYVQPKENMFSQFGSGVKNLLGGNSLVGKLDQNRQTQQSQLDQLK